MKSLVVPFLHTDDLDFLSENLKVEISSGDFLGEIYRYPEIKNSYINYFQILQKNDQYYLFTRHICFKSKYERELYRHVLFSTDGINFTHRQQLVDIDTLSNNDNLDLNMCQIANSYVFIDHDNNFKAIGGMGQYEQSRICLFKSNDAISWKSINPNLICGDQVIQPEKRNVCKTYFDSFNQILYHPIKKVYMSFLRYNRTKGVREIQTAKTSCLTDWSSSTWTLWKHSLLNDQETTKETETKETESYQNLYVPNVSVYPDGDCWLAFPMIHHSRLLPKYDQDYSNMMYSKNGIDWLELSSKFLGSVELPYVIMPEIVISPDKNQFYIYVEKFNLLNRSGRPWRTDVKVLAYSFRLHGLGYLISNNNKQATVITKKLKLSTSKLWINFESYEPSGYIVVKLLALVGEAIQSNEANNQQLIAKCEPITGNYLEYLVKWKENKVKEQFDSELEYQFKFMFKGVKLYSFRYQQKLYH